MTLRLPPPLDEVLRLDDEGRVWDDHALIAEARLAPVGLTPPDPVSWGDALAAQVPDLDSPFPHCFVCGTERAEGDGLRIFAGPVAGRDVYAATWTVRADTVGPEFVWASLDCPGAYATGVPGRGTVVLARLTARVDRVPQAGEPLRRHRLASRQRAPQARRRHCALHRRRRAAWAREGALARAAPVDD